jgi:uncharacterized protein YkwD
MRVSEGGHRRAAVLTLTVIAFLTLATVAAPEAMAGYRGRVLRIVNATRENQGLHLVSIDRSLSRKAMRHTRKMLRENAIFDPSNLSQLMSGEPWNTIAGSVAGCGSTLRRVHRAFLHDAVHRAILLNPDMRRIGIGAVKATSANACGRGSFWTTELLYG